MLPQKPFSAASALMKDSRSSMGVRVRHRDVAGQQVEQGRDVAGPLDAGVPAQRHGCRRRAGRCCRAATAGSHAARMYCAPTVCWVQPTAYANALVRSLPELLTSASQTSANSSGGTPQTCSTISGVYRE